MAGEDSASRPKSRHDDENDSIHADDASVGSAASDEVASVNSDVAWFNALADMMWKGSGGPETMPVVNVDYDLSTLDDFTNPCDLFKEIAAIKAYFFAITWLVHRLILRLSLIGSRENFTQKAKSV